MPPPQEEDCAIGDCLGPQTWIPTRSALRQREGRGRDRREEGEPAGYPTSLPHSLRAVPGPRVHPICLC